MVASNPSRMRARTIRTRTMATFGAVVRGGLDDDVAAMAADDAIDGGQAGPVPAPGGFVGKNGSKILA